MNVKATVFIPTLNGGEEFRAVVEAVRAQETEFPFEILVIDSKSDDGTDRAAAEAGARVISIDRREFNHGLTRNRGIREAGGEFVALLTQDARPADTHWLQALVEAVEGTPGAAGAYCRQIPRPDADPFIRDRLGRWAATNPDRRVQEIGNAEAFWALPPLARLEKIAFDNVASCVRKSAVDEHPFDDRPFGEDVAWSLKVMLRGYRIVYEPSAAVVHSHRESLWTSFRRVYLDHRNLNRLLGVSLIPGVRGLLKGWWTCAGFYKTIINETDGLSRLERVRWRLYGRPYGMLQVLAQYLGPRAPRWRERSRLYRWIDRLIVRRG